MRTIRLTILTLLLVSLPTHGGQFTTEELQLRLPSGWSCDPDPNLILCSEESTAYDKSGAITVKYEPARPTDTLTDFRHRLRQPKKTPVTNGAPRVSKVVSFQDRSINGVTWVEGLHFEGELPDYYTYYLATRWGGRFFLITFSAHQQAWPTLKNEFEQSIASLRILIPDEPNPAPSQALVEVATPSTVETSGAKGGLGPLLKKAPFEITRSRIFLFLSLVLFGIVWLVKARE